MTDLSTAPEASAPEWPPDASPAPDGAGDSGASDLSLLSEPPAIILARFEEAGWRNLHNRLTPNPESLFIDHVAIGAAGVFVIDSHSFELTESGPVTPPSDVLARVQRMADAVRSVLPPLTRQYVVPVLTYADKSAMSIARGAVQVCTTSMLARVIESRHDVLSAGEIDDVLNTLDTNLNVGDPATRPAALEPAPATPGVADESAKPAEPKRGRRLLGRRNAAAEPPPATADEAPVARIATVAPPPPWVEPVAAAEPPADLVDEPTPEPIKEASVDDGVELTAVPIDEPVQRTESVELAEEVEPVEALTAEVDAVDDLAVKPLAVSGADADRDSEGDRDGDGDDRPDADAISAPPTERASQPVTEHADPPIADLADEPIELTVEEIAELADALAVERSITPLEHIAPESVQATAAATKDDDGDHPVAEPVLEVAVSSTAADVVADLVGEQLEPADVPEAPTGWHYETRRRVDAASTAVHEPTDNSLSEVFASAQAEALHDGEPDAVEIDAVSSEAIEVRTDEPAPATEPEVRIHHDVALTDYVRELRIADRTDAEPAPDELVVDLTTPVELPSAQSADLESADDAGDDEPTMDDVTPPAESTRGEAPGWEELSLSDLAADVPATGVAAAEPVIPQDTATQPPSVTPRQPGGRRKAPAKGWQKMIPARGPSPRPRRAAATPSDVAPVAAEAVSSTVEPVVEPITDSLVEPTTSAPVIALPVAALQVPIAEATVPEAEVEAEVAPPAVAEPEAAKPEAAKPEAEVAAAEVAEPEAEVAAAEVAEPEAEVEAEVAESEAEVDEIELAAAEAAVPDSATPEAAVPEAAVPEAAEPEAEVAAAEAAVPEAAEPEAEVAAAEAAVPEAAVPEAEAAVPEAAVPEAAVPEAAEREVEEPLADVVEAETAETEAADPEADPFEAWSAELAAAQLTERFAAAPTEPITAVQPIGPAAWAAFTTDEDLEAAISAPARVDLNALYRDRSSEPIPDRREATRAERRADPERSAALRSVAARWKTSRVAPEPVRPAPEPKQAARRELQPAGAGSKPAKQSVVQPAKQAAAAAGRSGAPGGLSSRGRATYAAMNNGADPSNAVAQDQGDKPARSGRIRKTLTWLVLIGVLAFGALNFGTVKTWVVDHVPSIGSSDSGPDKGGKTANDKTNGKGADAGNGSGSGSGNGKNATQIQ